MIEIKAPNFIIRFGSYNTRGRGNTSCSANGNFAVTCSTVSAFEVIMTSRKVKDTA